MVRNRSMKRISHVGHDILHSLVGMKRSLQHHCRTGMSLRRVTSKLNAALERTSVRKLHAKKSALKDLLPLKLLEFSHRLSLKVLMQISVRTPVPAPSYVGMPTYICLFHFSSSRVHAGHKYLGVAGLRICDRTIKIRAHTRSIAARKHNGSVAGWDFMLEQLILLGFERVNKYFCGTWSSWLHLQASARHDKGHWSLLNVQITGTNLHTRDLRLEHIEIRISLLRNHDDRSLFSTNSEIVSLLIQ